MTLTAPRVSIDGYEPKHLSYSTVDGYRTCGMRHRLQKVLQVEQRPGLAGIGGNAVHTGTEWLDLEAEETELPLDKMFRLAWDQEIDKRMEQSPNYRYPEDYVATGKAGAEFGGKQNHEWWFQNGPIMLQRWIDWRAANPDWRIWDTPEGRPAVELELNIVLPGDIPVKMFIDRMMVTPAGQLVPVDIKSGRLPETAEQLGLYSVAVGLEWGEMFKSDWGYWWDAKKGTHSSPLALSMYTADYFADMYAQAIAGMNSGCFLAKPNNGCVRWCGVAKNCPAVGGSLPV